MDNKIELSLNGEVKYFFAISISLTSTSYSGSSNGGMFTYAQMDKLNDIIASFGPVVATGILGFPASTPLNPPGMFL